MSLVCVYGPFTSSDGFRGEHGCHRIPVDASFSRRRGSAACSTRTERRRDGPLARGHRATRIRRNRLDAEAIRHRRVAIGVHEERHIGVSHRPLDGGVWPHLVLHHNARRAPGRAEVHEHRTTRSARLGERCIQVASPGDSAGRRRDARRAIVPNPSGAASEWSPPRRVDQSTEAVRAASAFVATGCHPRKARSVHNQRSRYRASEERRHA